MGKHERLYELLEEYDRSRAIHRRIAYNAIGPGTPLAMARHAVCAQVKSLILSGEFPEHVAVDWWDAKWQGTPHNSRERFLKLQALLDHLDQHLARREVRHYRTSRGALVVGRRWWKWAMREAMKDGDEVAQENFPARGTFAHLRRVSDVVDWEILPSDLFAATGGKLRIGLCPLSGTVTTAFGGTAALGDPPGEFGYYATAMSGPPSHYEQELRNCAKWAVDTKVHVLCLPELSVCPQGRDILLDALTTAGGGAIRVVVPGTFHDTVVSDDGGEARHNRGPIWAADGTGLLLARGWAFKQEPFTLSLTAAQQFPALLSVVQAAQAAGCGAVAEDIDPYPPPVFLDTEVGVLAFVICRDFMAPDVIDRALTLADHVVVISLAVDPEAYFWQHAKHLARRHGAALYYVNSAQVKDACLAGNHMAFVRFPGLHPRIYPYHVAYAADPTAAVGGKSAKRKETQSHIVIELQIPPGILPLLPS